jgi:hypothetical protein
MFKKESFQRVEKIGYETVYNTNRSPAGNHYALGMWYS